MSFRRYLVRMTDTQEIIEDCDTAEEGTECIRDMEICDEKDGVFKPCAYEIYDTVEDKVVRCRP